MEYYKKNLDILMALDERLALRVEDAVIGNDITILIAEDGLPTLSVQDNPIHSIHTPEKEGEEIVKSYDLNNIDSAIILGLGLGYHIFPLFKNPLYPLIIIEQRLDILKIAMKVMDMGLLIKRCILLVGLNIGEIIDNEIIKDCINARALIFEHRPSSRLNKDYYNEIRTHLAERLSHKSNVSLSIKSAHLSSKRRWGEIDRLSPDFQGKLNILMASISSPISSPIFYERAFKKAHNVITFGPYRDRAFWEGYARRVVKSYYFYRGGAAEHWVDICTRLTKPCDIVTQEGNIDTRDILKRLPSAFKPDIFIWIDQYKLNIPINLDCLGCPTIALFGDTHVGASWRLPYARNFDYVFIMFNKHHIEAFKRYGCEKVFWSPAACDPEIHVKIPVEKIYPVSFVGSTDPNTQGRRIELLQFIKDNNIDIYIDSKVLQEMSLVFSRSKIVLNKSLANDLNMRVFEALGSGSLLLTNRLTRNLGLEELFTNKKHLVIYDNQYDLLDLINYYLKNDEEREAIALAGYKEALNKHTYNHRVLEIIKTVQDDIFRT